MNQLRFWISLLFCGGFACCLSAQVAFGPHISGQLTSLQESDSDLSEVPSLRAGWSLGMMAQIDIKEKWALQPELMYNRRGYEAFEQTVAINTIIFDGDVVTDYLQLNTHLKYYLSKKSDTDWYVLFGPYFAFNNRRVFKGEQGLPGLTSDFEIDLLMENNGLEDINLGVNNRFDFGVNVGIGGQFDLGKPWFFAELRYMQGIWNINGDAQGSTRHFGLSGVFGWLVYLSGDR